MPNKCFLCGFTYVVGGEISLHTLPTNPSEREMWLQRISWKEPLLENKKYYLCSNHFPEDCFLKTYLRKRLIKGSLPNFQIPPVHLDDGIIRNRSSTDSQSQSTEVSSLSRKRLRFNTPPFNISSLNTSERLDTKAFTGQLIDKDETSDSERTWTLTSPSKCGSFCSSITYSPEEQKMKNMKKKRFLSNPRYIGDYTYRHMENPTLRKKLLRLSQRTVSDLKKRNIILTRQVKNLKNSIRNLQDLAKNVRQNFPVEEDMENALNLSISGSTRPIFERLLRGPTRQKYSEELRAFALTLHYYSPRAYSYVRSTFNNTLPEPRTLRTWCSNIDGGPGFNKLALGAIKQKVSKAKSNNKELVGALLMDEISIRKLIEWNEGKLKGIADFKGYIGKQDHEIEEAREVLVFMVVFLNENYKVPVAYFFTNGVSAEDKASILVKLLDQIEETGLRIATITFDGLSSNFKMSEILGADFSNKGSLKTWFTYPSANQNRSIYFILDPSHMIKLVRNTIGKKKKIIHNRIHNIEWRHIENLVSFQNNQGLHAATKIRLRHVKYEKEKMKVKLATQTLSRSVSDALIFLEKDLKIADFTNAENTANFCRIFNDLFDIFNSRNLYSKSPYRKALSTETYTSYFSFLDHCYNYITNLELDNGKKLIHSDFKTGFLGFLINIVSLKGIYQDFINCHNPPLQFLLSYKLSQDHLEIFFSSIRSRGGFNNNPTSRQFEAAFKRLLLHTHIKASSSANVTSIDDIILLPVQNSTATVDSENVVESFEDPAGEDHIYAVNSKNWHLSEYTEDVVIYIAGFVVAKIQRKINCQNCVSLLKSNNTESKLQSRKTLGQLTNASQFIIDICTQAEKTFRWAEKVYNIFEKKYSNILPRLVITTLKNLNSFLFDVFHEHFYDDEAERNHGTLLSKLILETYFNLRIHHELKNRQSCKLDSNRLRSRLTKTIIFLNQ